MKKIHRTNLIIVVIAAFALSVTAVGKYGSTDETRIALISLGIGTLIAIVAYFIKVNDNVKALGITLVPSICAIVYSGAVHGSTAAFIALFIVLGMTTVYFQKRIILLYSVPMSIVLLIIAFANPMIIEGASGEGTKGALIKVISFMLTAVILFKATSRGENTYNEVNKMLEKVQSNFEREQNVATNLNSSIAVSVESIHDIRNLAKNVGQ